MLQSVGSTDTISSGLNIVKVYPLLKLLGEESQVSIIKFATFVSEFEGQYDAATKEETWTDLSKHFRHFWTARVMSTDIDPISDADCDKIIKILDRNGKGNTKNSEAIARAMVSQGAWRKLFNELHINKLLGEAVDKVIRETDPVIRAQYIDQLYAMESAQGIYLTGQSGNTISALIAGFDPLSNLSIISLKDRRLLLEYLKSPYLEKFDSESIGSKIANSNIFLAEAIRAEGINGNARKISTFCYFEPIKELWRSEFLAPKEHTNKNEKNGLILTVSKDQDDSFEPLQEGDVRESIQIQGLLAKIGEEMGFDIWLPNPDRARVAKVWQPRDPRSLLTSLPLSYDKTTLSTISLIDVIWIKNKRSIARAFEVEHTTSIYSGILRMADLVALQPDISIKLHIVAPIDRQEKFATEIRRPVFSYMTNGSLSEMCTFISYDDVKHIANLQHLNHTSDKILGDFEISAERTDD